MNVIITTVTAIATTLLLFTIVIFPPLSTSAQNMTDNMTSSNITQGASVENMTDVGGISSLEGGGGGGGSGSDSDSDSGDGDGSDDDGDIEGSGGGGGSGSGGSVFIYN